MKLNNPVSGGGTVDLSDYVNKTTDTLDNITAGTINQHFSDVEKEKLAGIDDDADVNVQADWSEVDNTQDAFIQNKPTLGTVASKDVGNQTGQIQENGAALSSSEIVETDVNSKLITAVKNTAYNKNFGTTATDVARGDASYLKADTYTQTEIDNALTANSTTDRARANHTGEQAISTVTGLQNSLDDKEDIANKGVANGYPSLDANAQVPLSQIPSSAKSSKVVADISARDAIASADRFEGVRVHVLDASADTTVDNGAAGYILKSGLANTDWEKVYESESLDVDLSDYFDKTTDTTDNITEGTAKFTTQADIDKLAGIESGAEVNVQANLSQTDNTQDDYVSGKSTANITDTTDKRYITDAQQTVLTNTSGTNTGDETTASIKTKRPLKTVEGQSIEGSGNIDLTSADVGLGNVDNTSDANKPVSTAQQTALDAKIAKASNLSDVANRQTALNYLTNVGISTNEHVLTKDTATGNVIFKAIPSLQALLPTGSIIASIANSLTGALKFDGSSSYSKSTYSALYALISAEVGAAYDIDANNFYLPNASGRVLGIAGQGSGLTLRDIFSYVGTETHTLSIDEMPSHRHGIFKGSVETEGSRDEGGYPSIDTSELTENTASDTVELSGGSQAHNNMQPTIFAGKHLFIYY